MNKLKKEYSFDMLRVIAMIMVICIHVSNIYCRSYNLLDNTNFIISLIFNTICRISVPVFFMISGSLMLDRKINKEKYFKRLFKFLMLIIIWGIIYLIWEYFYFGNTYENLYMMLITPFRAHLWFLYTILIIYLVQPLLKIILEKINNTTKIVLLIIWFILSAAGILNYYIAKVFTVFVHVGYFIIGKYLYDYIKSKDLKKYNIIFVITILLCVISSVLLNYSYSLKNNMFYNLFFAYRMPFIILSSFSFFTLIVTNYKKGENKILTLFSNLSLGVYLLHGIFLDITSSVFNYQSIDAIYGIPFFTFVIFILSILSVYILSKIKIIKNII